VLLHPSLLTSVKVRNNFHLSIFLNKLLQIFCDIQDNKIKQDATYTEVEKKSDKQMPTTTEKIGQKMYID